MKSPLSKNIDEGKEKEGVRINKRLVTFIFCLLLSSFFWIMMSLSKGYSIEVKFPVNYINFPNDKVVANRLPETVDIEIKSTGFNLFFYKLNQQLDTVLIDIKDAKQLATINNFYILPNKRIEKIAGQFNNEIKIMKVYPDTIILNYNKKITKKIPVIANIKIDFDHLYQQADSIKITPKYIQISGSEEIIDRINFAKTLPITLHKVSDSVSIQLEILATEDLKSVEIDDPNITATINVTKFTEASVELPIEVENLPNNLSVKTFPDKVTVKYSVAFNNYEKITPSLFRAIVDYSTIKAGSNKLKIKLVQLPSEIRSVKIYPEKAEYIIRKQ